MNADASRRSQPSLASIFSRKSMGSSIMGDLGSRSEISSFENEPTTDKGFVWKSQWQHAMYFIAYTFSWGMFSSYRKGGGIDNMADIPTWFHILFVYVFFAGPLLYLQIFIGQYTQRGCIVIGTMLPLAYGFGYAMLINTMINCSLNIYFCSIVLYYAFVAMINYPTPSWMLCLSRYKASEKNCYSRDEIDLCPSCWTRKGYVPDSCFQPNRDVLSASLFNEIVIFGNDPSNPESQSLLAPPNAVQTVHLMLTAIFIICLAIRSLKDLDDSIRIWNVFAVVAIIITIAVVLLNHPRLDFIANMFYFKLESIFNMNCWTKAISATAHRLNIMEGGHFLFGSYMPLTVNCTTRVTYLLMVHLVFLFLCNVEGYMLEDYLACNLNIQASFMNQYSDVGTTFAVYPMALGILAASQLWSTLYFVILFSLTLHSIVIQIILIQETLSQEIIDPSYYVYTRVMLIVVTTGAAIFFTTPCGSELAAEVFLRRGNVLFTLLSLIYLILFSYGIDRFSDDIHFILHSPPSKYLKWSWALSGMACAAILIFRIFRHDNLRYPKTAIALVVVIFIPMPIGFFYQLMKAVRARELSSLMKPSNNFGPQDVEERANRRLFNPRFEVRFRRRRNVCKHRCLLNSVTLRRCLEKELTLLNHVLAEIEDNEEERVLKKDFLDALRVHREIMTNALNFDPSKEYFRNRRTERKFTTSAT